MHDQDPILLAALRDAAITREVAMASGALSSLPSIASRCLGGARVQVVADDATYAAAGVRANEHLIASNLRCTDPMILSESPRLKPKVETAEGIAARLRDTDSVAIAVGSGVINDLVKYASALVKRPYVCVATAASMDGYAASGAALLDSGFKRTFQCDPAVAVLADLDVLARAPLCMASWGYGDMAGKFIAGADWTIADALGCDEIDRRSYAMVQDHLHAWLDSPQRLNERSPEAFGRLLTGLLVSGFAMQAHGNSRPASGSDHQIAHLWEMEGVSIAGVPVAHGACVGIGCVAMLALYEWLLEQPIGATDIERAVATSTDHAALEREIACSFSDATIVESAHREMREKTSSGRRGDRMRRLAQGWPQLRARLTESLPSATQMQQSLRAAGGAAHPADLGIGLPKLAADYRRARLIRRRYTVLDLVDELGWLDRAIDALFAVDGFWGRQQHATTTTREAAARASQ
ncbi:MAG TPA: sn-glycerol-1-phosphate dehydrogenase [Casimicrobiaceae bacterium]|nr:sn-glycerol-1-phosphate dehydrogenase [Casimicrobiaceae bacterium]